MKNHDLYHIYVESISCLSLRHIHPISVFLYLQYMYLPQDPDVTSREVNSRRRTAATSIRSHGQQLKSDEKSRSNKINETGGVSPHDYSSTSYLDVFGTAIRKSIRYELYHQEDGIYKHGKEGERPICPWCICDENQLTPTEEGLTLIAVVQ